MRETYRSVGNQLNIKFIPNETVYPFINGRENGEKWEDHLAIPFRKEEVDRKLSDECFGLHWYGGCQAAKQYNLFVNEKTYKTQDCIITREIDKILCCG